MARGIEYEAHGMGLVLRAGSVDTVRIRLNRIHLWLDGSPR